MNKIIKDQEELRLSSVYLNSNQDITDVLFSEFTYDDVLHFVITGGSGEGQIQYEVKAETGESTIVLESQSHNTYTFNLSFVKEGNVVVRIYKESDDTPIPDLEYDGNPVYYGRSKLLSIQFTLENRLIKVQVLPNTLVRTIGQPIPSIPNTFRLDISGLQNNDSIQYTSDNIYYVYNSDDFYKFDVISKAYSETRYDNGVRFVREPLSGWIISGTPGNNGYPESMRSLYRLIESPYRLPNYIIRGRTYKLQSTGIYSNDDSNYNGVNWIIYVYQSNGDIEVYNSTNAVSVNTEFTIPDNAVGISMFLKVQSDGPGGVIVRTEDTQTPITIHMYDIDERKMDNNVEIIYPVSARNLVVPNSNYIDSIHYRSAFLQFVNNRDYKVIIE